MMTFSSCSRRVLCRRKGIEHAINLLAAIGNPKCKLVITHESGDEGDEYHVGARRDGGTSGRSICGLSRTRSATNVMTSTDEKTYDLADAYAHADFITYPSIYEGFGNALIEAFYFRKPVLVNRYSIFVTDIEPKGFRVITMNGYLTKDVVEHVKKVISWIPFTGPRWSTIITSSAKSSSATQCSDESCGQ